MSGHFQKKRAASAVAEACAKPIEEITVTITVKARVADDSPVAPLVMKALRELINRCPDEPEGLFESKDGLDVAWKAERGPVHLHLVGDEVSAERVVNGGEDAGQIR